MNCLLTYIIILLLIILYLQFKCNFTNQECDSNGRAYPSGNMPGSGMLKQ